MAHFILHLYLDIKYFITRTYVYRIKFKYNSIEITPKIFHYDFEKAISNVAEKDIFKKTYLINFETENWNYYNNIEHITNNETVRNDFIELCSSNSSSNSSCSNSSSSNSSSNSSSSNNNNNNLIKYIFKINIKIKSSSSSSLPPSSSS
ncbi:hypothetical protein H8356DRAFT_1333417 [Neocallimastix lanati (nom. inval.)]|nr:hypothetical protein H8356DRAFT_1333417 [Neocallimastix sp. JGI-2020a]